MSYKFLDLSGLQRFLNKVKDLIPTKTSELTNDSGFITQADTVDSALSSTSEKAVQNKVIKQALDSKANDNSVVHTTGNESISGTKSFNSDLNLNYASTDVDDIIDSIPGLGTADDYVHISGNETINGIKSFPDGIVANVSGTATPLAHTHTTSDITNLSIPSKVSDLTNDSGYITGVSWNDVSGKPSSFTPSSHTHGSITNDGKLGTAANKPLITGANGVITTGSFGTSANTFCQGNDSRLSDARTPLSHTHGNSDITSLDASKITSGTIDIARLPKGALERLVTVADQTSRFALTSNDVQLGDTVKQLDTGVMYIVSDDSKLSSADGYTEYTAGSATSVPWSGVTGKPSSYTPSSHTHGNITNDGKLGTASKVLITDSNKKITTSSVSNTELGYLSGVTSAIQTQISGKANASHTHSASDITSGLATVATSGSYNDLSNKPTIPTVNNATLTIQKNGTTVKTFTANASSNVTANITVPTKTSELTNDSGYLTSHQDISGLSAKADTIKSLSISGRTITYTKGDDTTGTLTTQDNNTWTAMVGATSSANGSVGYVNAVPPKDGYNTKYLRADGTWAVPPDHTYTVNNKTLTIQKNGTSVATFTANSASDVTANIVVPTKTSDLTNDSHQTITAGTDSTSTASPAHGGTFTCIDSVTKDSNGHVTAVNTKTVTLPSDNNTDTLVTQNVSTANENHPILLTVTKDATANQGAKTSIFASGVKVNPSTNTVTATTFSGALSGNASSATQFSANTTVALTGDATGTSAGSKKGWSVPVTLANSGVTAGTYGPSADVTGNNNATISVPQITVDAKGRVTSVTNRTLTCKNNTYTVNNATLTIQKNGTNVATFTSNASSNVTANITVPTKTSELTNNSGFLTSHQDLSLYPYKVSSFSGYGNGRWSYVDLGDTTTHPNGFNEIVATEKYHVRFTASTPNSPYAVTSTANDGILEVEGIGSSSNVSSHQRVVQRFYKINSAHIVYFRRGEYHDGQWNWSNWTSYGDIVTHNASEFLTSHQSLANYSTLANTVKSLSISGKTITVTPGSGSAYTLTTQDTVYTHPTTSGNKHIPSGGSSGQFLGWDSDGTAKWVNNPNTNTDTLVTQNVSTTNATYPLLLCPTANATANQGAKTSIFAKSVKINPSTNVLSATQLWSNSQTIQNSGFTKGTNPSAQSFWSMYMADKNGNDWGSNCLGVFETTCDTSGNVTSVMKAVKNEANSSSAGAISVTYNKSANTVSTYAPTPATSSNDTNIATTAWVRTYAETTKKFLTSHQSLSNYVNLNGDQTITGTKTFTAKPVLNQVGLDMTVKDTTEGSTTTRTSQVLHANSSNSQYGINIAFCSGGNAVVGGGEAGTAQLNELAGNNGEDLYLVADGSIYLKPNGNTWANAKTITLNTAGEFSGLAKVTATSFVGALTGNVTGNCSGSSGSCTGNAATATTAGNVTGTVAIANGGTGATSRLNAVKALTNEDVGTNAQFFLTITTNWGKAGYCSVANAKTVLGVPTKTSQLTNDSGYLTSHQSLANYLTKTTNVSEMGRYIDLHYDNATSKYDYDVRLYADSQGTAAGGGSFKIAAATAYAPAPASDANDTRIATTKWVKDRGFLTSHQSLANYVTLDGTQTISGAKTFSSNLVYTSSLAKKHSSITKGTNPSSTAYWTIGMCDKDGLNAANNALGMFETSLDKYGTASSYLRAYKNTAGSNTVSEVRAKYDTTNDKGWITCTGEDICLISNKKTQGTVPTANQDCAFKMFDNSSHTMFEIRNRSVANSSNNQTYTAISTAPNTSGAGVTDAFRIYAQTDNSSTICNVLTQNFLPISNNTYNLGDNSHRWKSIHVTHPGATDSSNLVATTAWVRARVKDIISGGGSTSAGGISPVEGTIILGLAASTAVTYSTTSGAVLTSPVNLFPASVILTVTNGVTQTTEISVPSDTAVGGWGTWKLMNYSPSIPGTTNKYIFGLWVKVA